jgi:NitT/TauT family transport system substrate-binding protein
MSNQQAAGWSRREFLGGLTLAGTAGLLGLSSGLVTAEPPPETTRIRLARTPGLCVAPEYMAEALLQGEGFTEVQYVTQEKLADKYPALVAGAVDLTLYFSAPFLFQLEAGTLLSCSPACTSAASSCSGRRGSAPSAT